MQGSAQVAVLYMKSHIRVYTCMYVCTCIHIYIHTYKKWAFLNPKGWNEGVETGIHKTFLLLYNIFLSSPLKEPLGHLLCFLLGYSIGNDSGYTSYP